MNSENSHLNNGKYSRPPWNISNNRTTDGPTFPPFRKYLHNSTLGVLYQTNKGLALESIVDSYSIVEKFRSYCRRWTDDVMVMLWRHSSITKPGQVDQMARSLIWQQFQSKSDSRLLSYPFEHFLIKNF